MCPELSDLNPPYPPQNVAVKDQLDRLAMDGSEKFRVQGREVVAEGLALGLPMHGFALYVAAWAHFVAREVRMRGGTGSKPARGDRNPEPYTLNIKP